MTQHYDDDVSVVEEEQDGGGDLMEDGEVYYDGHRDLSSTASTSSIIRTDVDDDLVGGGEGTSKKRALPFGDETNSFEYNPFPLDLVKTLIQSQYYLASPRSVVSMPLEVPLSLFSGDRKLAAVVATPTNRYYLVAKVISPKYVAQYFVFYQNVLGLCSTILRQLSNLEKASSENFIQNFRWIEHSFFSNHFLLAILRSLRLFFSGTDIAVIAKKSVTFGIRSLLKEFSNQLPPQYCLSPPQKCAKK